MDIDRAALLAGVPTSKLTEGKDEVFQVPVNDETAQAKYDVAQDYQQVLQEACDGMIKVIEAVAKKHNWAPKDVMQASMDQLEMYYDHNGKTNEA